MADSYIYIPPLPERDAEDQIRFLRLHEDYDVANALDAFMDGSQVQSVLFHGTTHDFDSFDVERGDPDGRFGNQGVYLTTSTRDASVNYARIGPDLQKNIDDRADEIIERLRTRWSERYGSARPFPRWGSPLYNRFHRWAEHHAKKDLYGDRLNILPVFARITNPVILEQSGGTYLEMEYPLDPDDISEIESMQAHLAEVQRKIEQMDPGSEEYAEAEDALLDLESELATLRQTAEDRRYQQMPEGTGMLVLRAAQDVAARYDDVDYEAIQDLEFRLEEGMHAYDVEQALQRAFGLATDEDGRMSMPNAVAEVWQRAGYDAIILDAYREFGASMDGLNPGDRHVFVFDPRQIKSAIGCYTYDTRSTSLTDADLRLERQVEKRRTRGLAKADKIQEGREWGERERDYGDDLKPQLAGV